MKKIKEFWINNKVLVVLGVILVACLIAILVVASTYFFGGSDSPYGQRLENQSDYEFDEKMQDEFIDKIKESELVKDASLNYQEIVIYVHINFEDNVTRVEAESIAIASLENLSEDILSYYDLNFIIKSDATEESEGFTAIGARNVVSGKIVWTNDTKIEVEEE